MKRKHTEQKKAQRLNLWHEYQQMMFGTSVAERRANKIMAPDSGLYDRKHPNLKDEVKRILEARKRPQIQRKSAQ